LILSILYSGAALNRHTAMTVSEIIATENFDYQENTFYKYLKKFLIEGFVSNGIKEGKALTFYITTEGIKKLEEERKL
jgi:predicted transcriptional regulator